MGDNGAKHHKDDYFNHPYLVPEGISRLMQQVNELQVMLNISEP